MLKLLRVVLAVALTIVVANASVITQTRGRVASSSGSSSGGFNPGDPTFFDSFNFTMGRDDSGASKISAVQARGWASLKDETTLPGGARLWWRTIDYTALPGTSGVAPWSTGKGLLLENHPILDTGNTPPQTSGEMVMDPWPAIGYIRFWFRFMDTSPMNSTFSGSNKFIYPANTHPATPGSIAYLLQAGRFCYEHHNPVATLGTDTGSAPGNQLYFCLQCYGFVTAGQGNCANTQDTEPSENPTTVLYNNVERCALLGDTDYEVTFYIDVASVAGTYKFWLRERGEQRRLCANFVSGVTTGFTWTTNVSTRGGHSRMLMPESVNSEPGQTGDEDSFYVMADLALADTWADLPSYGDDPNPSFQGRLDAANDDVFLVRASR